MFALPTCYAGFVTPRSRGADSFMKAKRRAIVARHRHADPSVARWGIGTNNQGTVQSVLRRNSIYANFAEVVRSSQVVMSIEIERRFLVRSESWRQHVVRRLIIQQGYLASEGNATVRVRIVDNRNATLTIKSHAAATFRHEFEYSIPLDDALGILKLRSGGLVRKVRHIVISHGLTWEIDVFEGENAGLVIAELELKAFTQQVKLPDWAGREISGDVRYSNSHLARWPFRSFTHMLRDADLTQAGE